ncbi:DUF2470 domain-containing protein [Microbacterium horticulturae]|uniref:DUF2470 domain-containing protein n=1 Tax=Microbacterium horticulturae TaxID=3028316 RepID=A0ABY8C0Z5_9MICO|nr:DUF2470 domain-containing protein [Microbacterium sp. KACC 23027]WEG08716.1 DUF2470 domain-containing protein [Microbacterium sp. KACC 23027]
MPHVFDTDAVTAILTHMNGDHTDDNLLIVRAFGEPDAVSARMIGLDGEAGEWEATGVDAAATTVRVPWPGGPITERPAVRKAVVLVYREACARLGVEPRSH